MSPVFPLLGVALLRLMLSLPLSVDPFFFGSEWLLTISLRLKPHQIARGVDTGNGR